MAEIIEERKNKLTELKKLLTSGKDKGIVDDIAEFYVRQEISDEVLREYLHKNLSQKEVAEHIEIPAVTKQEIVLGKNSPLISVIIPTYAGYLPIETTIDSVLNQTYHNVEVLVIDDAGNFVTRELMLRKYRKDKRVRYIESKNKIVKGTEKRRVGFVKAKGEYIVFLDHDDFYLDMSFFERAIKFFEGQEHGKKRKERFAFYGANAFEFYEFENFYTYNKLNVSGEYTGEKYLYGISINYDKPLSVFSSVFVKQKLQQSNLLQVEGLGDVIIYMLACLSGNAYISDYVIGAYRKGTNASTKGANLTRTVFYCNTRKQIMGEALKRYPNNDWKEWLLKQVEFAFYLFDIESNQIVFNELLKAELWGFRHFGKDFKACGKYFLSKYIKQNDIYHYDDTKIMKKQINRLEKYYEILNQWMINKNMGNRMGEYFHKNGWKQISVYGYGELGKRLIEELSQDSKISIVSIVDNSFTFSKEYLDTRFFSLQDNLPKADITVITPVFALDAITSDLNKKGINNCVSIEDILKKM